MFNFFHNYCEFFSLIFCTQRLTNEAYVVTKLCIILVTGVCSLLVSKYYDPLNKSHIVGNRALQHLNPHEKFCVVTSVLNEDPVRVLLNLIEVSCVEDRSSACIYVLHLVELGGRGNSSLTAHRNSKGEINHEKMDRLHNAFINYEKKKKGVLVVHPFTAISPYSTMHQDICSLAIDKNVPFIIVPFPRKDSRASSEVDRVARSMVPQVLSQVILLLFSNIKFLLVNLYTLLKYISTFRLHARWAF